MPKSFSIVRHYDQKSKSEEQIDKTKTKKISSLEKSPSIESVIKKKNTSIEDMKDDIEIFNIDQESLYIFENIMFFLKKHKHSKYF